MNAFDRIDIPYGVDWQAHLRNEGFDVNTVNRVLGNRYTEITYEVVRNRRSIAILEIRSTDENEETVATRTVLLFKAPVEIAASELKDEIVKLLSTKPFH
jgi:hypothetical protein